MREIILLNVGNTHTQQALCRAAPGLGRAQRLRTTDFLAADARTGLLQQHPDCAVLAACVVPDAAARLRRSWPDRDLRFLTASMVHGLSFANVDVATVGADRLANAAAVVALTAPPVVLLDCGTAVTTEVIDGRGHFLGGAIVPGRELMRRALHEHTGQLPLVALRADRPLGVGRTTADAIAAGVDAGIIGAVDLLLVDARRVAGDPACAVIAVGGDAPFFVRALPQLTPGPADLTLQGLARVARDEWPSA